MLRRYTDTIFQLSSILARYDNGHGYSFFEEAEEIAAVFSDSWKRRYFPPYAIADAAPRFSSPMPSSMVP